MCRAGKHLRVRLCVADAPLPPTGALRLRSLPLKSRRPSRARNGSGKRLARWWQDQTAACSADRFAAPVAAAVELPQARLHCNLPLLLLLLLVQRAACLPALLLPCTENVLVPGDTAAAREVTQVSWTVRRPGNDPSIKITMKRMSIHSKRPPRSEQVDMNASACQQDSSQFEPTKCRALLVRAACLPRIASDPLQPVIGLFKHQSPRALSAPCLQGKNEYHCCLCVL